MNHQSSALAASLENPAGYPLTPDMLEEIEGLLAPLRRTLGEGTLSEYAFSNLYLFRHAHAYRYLPGRFPCISGLTYDGTRHLLPLFDLHAVDSRQLGELLQGHDCFYPIAQRDLDAFDSRRFAWVASPDDADYFYPASNFRDYRGDILRKKRNLMRQLLAEYRIESVELDDARMADAHAVLSHWMTDKGKGAGEADQESCLEALRLSRRFGFDARIYYADGVPAGFLIAQKLVPTVAAMRFAKGNDAYKGIYQYMFHHFCQSTQHDVAWLNFEQDLGLANFRQTKRSYLPSAMLEKFRVSLRA